VEAAVAVDLPALAVLAVVLVTVFLHLGQTVEQEARQQVALLAELV
jgi:hypothetical protein